MMKSFTKKAKATTSSAKAGGAPEHVEDDIDEDDSSSSEEDDDVQEMLEEKAENITSEKRPQEPADSGPNKRFKLSKKELYKPPTAEELNSLKEVESLFHSNLFGLQLSDLLKETKLKEKHVLEFNSWMEFFRKTLRALPASKSPQDKPERILRKVKVPLKSGTPIDRKCRFHFAPPSDVKIVGSFPLNTAVGPDLTVDVALEMPMECLEKTDYLNQRYHRKRALYLSTVAAHLIRSELVEEMAFGLPHGDTTMPTLSLKPAGKAGKHFKVSLLPCPPSGYFKLSRFVPCRSNLRASWFRGPGVTELSDELPSSQYNAGMLYDIQMIALNDYLAEKLGSSQAMQDVIILLKVWLRRRQLDQGYGAFYGFLATAYVVYLLTSRKISAIMSSYQAMRYVLLSFSQTDWTKEPISLCTEKQLNQPTMEEFRQHYPLVFVDPSGFINLCARTSVETYLRVKHEAGLAINFLDTCSADSFHALFVAPVPFYRTFDCFVQLTESDIKTAAESLSLRDKLADADGDGKHIVARSVCSILRKGLGTRVALLSALLDRTTEWNLNSAPPAQKSNLVLGIVLSSPDFYRLVDRGPPADSPEAAEFREFWGEKSELRRFRDSSILEAVVWRARTACEQREVVLDIVRHLLLLHARIEGAISVGDFLDPLLRLGGLKWPSQKEQYGTGEEVAQNVVKTYDELAKVLRKLQDLPLDVSSVQGISASLRSTEVFPPFSGTLSIDFGTCYVHESQYLLPLPAKSHFYHYVIPTEVVVHMEATGKWPEDWDALRHIKAAFHIALAKLLKEQASLTTVARPDFIDVLKDGLVFRLRIACHKEITLAKHHVLPNGMVKLKDTDASLRLEYLTERLPSFTSALHGLQQQHNTFGCACRLAKRWVSAQLLYGHVPDECVELVVSYVYLMPAPYAVPNSPRVAFQRFLALLVNHDWSTQPLIINFADKLTRDQCADLQSTFINRRSALPPMFIATPFDSGHLSPWTAHAPTGQILHRLVALARESLRVLEEQIACPIDIDIRQIFRAPLNPYDVLIHLDDARVPNHYQSVDYAHTVSVKLTHKPLLPVVDLDVVTRYVQTLREAYDEFALFFYDHYGGNYVAVLWKPRAFEPQPFKVSALPGRMLNSAGNLIPNVEAILEDFGILGRGLVKSVEARTSKWKI